MNNKGAFALTQSDFRPEGIRRRTVLAGAGTAAVAFGLGIVPARFALAADEVPVAELMQPDGLKDLTLGSPDAKVTVVEYASMTCGHCARFHKSVFPELKEKYIDTNKIYFVMREFPLDNLAAAASMLARCAGDDKTFPLISVLFDKQADWAFVKSNPVPALREIAKQAGFTKESFDACLKDEDLLDKIMKRRERASSVFGVNSTPTFFINGKKLAGGTSIEDFSKVIDPILNAG